MRMTADFRYLIFANYAVDRELLEPRLPDGVQLHLLNGKAYLSLVAFLFENLHVQSLPAPFHQQFEEVNLRFYVRSRKDHNEEKNGVVFIREIVPKAMLAAAARVLFNEKYMTLPMEHHFQTGHEQINTVEYSWQTGKKSFIRVAFKNDWRYPETGSSQHFFMTRPYGFTRLEEGGTNEIQMEHPLWRVASVLDFATDYDIPSVFGEEFVPFLTLRPASIFVAEGSKVEVQS